jgi:hypothetical protein
MIHQRILPLLSVRRKPDHEGLGQGGTFEEILNKFLVDDFDTDVPIPSSGETWSALAGVR